ncbi:hypothetical protein BGX28_008317 [Mortierella sp. GBA30]|nr:hypothetical protein BGX28_008317 [Mortierella sp. GBA30]
MINSAKTLAPFFANDQETFLRDLIPTRSEITNKLNAAINNAGKDTRQRLRVLLDFDGAVTIQSSHLPSETRDFKGLGPIGAPGGADVPFDVILYNEDLEIMEATIANIAVEVKNEETGALEWITPPASAGLLCGTMRRKLLESGELRERVITVDDLKKAAQENRRMKCFNSVRKEYPVTLKA